MRSKTLRVRVTAEEMEEIERKADKARLDVSSWVRRVLLGPRAAADGRAKPRPAFDAETATVEELVDEMTRTASRAVLEVALRRFPDEPRFASWARVLAPGTARYLPPDPEQTTLTEERAWTAAHGRAYLGRWVAIHHTELLASGSMEEIQPALEACRGAVGFKVTET
jgi:hypothetical protein